ncbi:MAG: hypothetical protein ABIT08_06965 [Bacteroidia bacterium]
MEQLNGKVKVYKGFVSVEGQKYSYTLFKDPNLPEKMRTAVLDIPDHDSVMVEYDSEAESFKNVAEKIIAKHKNSKQLP